MERTIFDPCVAYAKWQILDEHEESRVGNAHIEQENKKLGCSCALRMGK